MGGRTSAASRASLSRAPLWHRSAFAAAVSFTLAGAGSAFAAESSNAELLKRIERLEKKNEELEKALEGERVSEKEPELATRLKAVEFQTLSMQKQARTIKALEGITAGVSFTTVAQHASGSATTNGGSESQCLRHGVVNRMLTSMPRHLKVTAAFEVDHYRQRLGRLIEFNSRHRPGLSNAKRRFKHLDCHFHSPCYRSNHPN